MFIEENESVERFEKFTKLVSERFDIKVRFDGVKAQTDGNEITLPNILAMSDKEIEFLYGILLHEIGHVKFSQFDKALFEKIGSHNHFCIINAIEDARIENKMMKVYEGAKDVFHQLYNVFTADKTYMEKIFKGSGGETAVWFSFSMAVHNILLDLANVDDKVVMGRNRSTVNVMMGAIKKMIDNASLNSTADAHTLGTKIYDHFFKNEADKSDKLEFKKEAESMEKGKEEIKKLLDQLRELNDLAQKIRKDVKGLRDTKKDKGKELDKFHKDHSKELEEAQKEAYEANDVAWDRKRLETAQADMAKVQEELNKLENQIKAIEQKIAERNGLVEKNKENIDKGNLTPTKKALAQKQNKSNERMNTNAEKKLEDLKERLKQAQENLKHAQERVKNWENEVKQNKNLTEEEIKQQLEQANKKLDPIYKQEGEYQKNINDLKSKIAQKMEEIKAMMEGNKAERMKAIGDLDKLLKSAGVEGAGIIPEFETSDWKEADGIQQGFDKDATQQTGMPVVNGMSPFGSSVRDIVMKLEDVSNKLDNIDLAKLFASKVRQSKLDSYNDTDADVPNSENTGEDIKALKSARKHFPVSTAFDIVREEIGGGDNQLLSKIRSDKKSDIDKLTNLIKLKFRFRQKPRFKGGQEDGTIDGRELWRVPTNLGNRIFEINEKKIDNKVQVAIAVDISGSMEKDYSEYGEKVRELTLMLSDALLSAHVKHEVLGYGAPVDDNMASLKGASSIYNRTRHRLETVVYRTIGGGMGIQNITTQTWDNADGESLRVIAKRLLKATSKKKVMFVITDGKPFLNDADTACLDQDLKNTLEWAKRNKIEVYGLGFNDVPKSFYGDNYCKVENMENLLKFLKERLVLVV